MYFVKRQFRANSQQKVRNVPFERRLPLRRIQTRAYAGRQIVIDPTPTALMCVIAAILA
jgi:hypothetical protein